MRNVPAHFEKKRVTVLECAIDQLLMLVFLSHNFCIARVCRQIDGERDEFFADYGLWAVDDELEYYWDALSVGECRL